MKIQTFAISVKKNLKINIWKMKSVAKIEITVITG